MDNISLDQDIEIWQSPKGENYEVSARYGKNIDPQTLKGDFNEYAKELDRVIKSTQIVKSKYNFENVSRCPICQSNDFSSDVEVYNISYVVCKRCNHAFTKERLSKESLDRYYHDSAEFIPVHVDKEKANVRVNIKAMPKLIHVIEQYKKYFEGALPKTYLDIGAGAGHSLSAAMKLGLQVYGIEPSKIGRDAAKELFDIELEAINLSNFCDTTKKKFDLISFWGVIEHTIDPLSNIRMAKSLLTKNGMIVLEVPRFDGLTTVLDRIYKDMGTRLLDGIEHINCFTDSSLATMLDYSDFKPIFVWYLGLDWYEFAMRSFIISKEDKVAKQIMKYFNALQLHLDRHHASDALIIGAVPK